MPPLRTRGCQESKTWPIRTSLHRNRSEHNHQFNLPDKNRNNRKNLINFREIKMIRIRKTFLPKKAHREFSSTKLLSRKDRWPIKCQRRSPSRDCRACGTRRRSKLEIWTVTQFWRLNSCHFRRWELQRVAFKSARWTKDKKQRCPTPTSRTNKMCSAECASRRAPTSWMACSKTRISTVDPGFKNCRFWMIEKMYWKSSTRITWRAQTILTRLMAFLDQTTSSSQLSNRICNHAPTSCWTSSTLRCHEYSQSRTKRRRRPRLPSRTAQRSLSLKETRLVRAVILLTVERQSHRFQRLVIKRFLRLTWRQAKAAHVNLRAIQRSWWAGGKRLKRSCQARTTRIASRWSKSPPKRVIWDRQNQSTPRQATSEWDQPKRPIAFTTILIHRKIRPSRMWTRSAASSTFKLTTDPLPCNSCFNSTRREATVTRPSSQERQCSTGTLPWPALRTSPAAKRLIWH